MSLGIPDDAEVTVDEDILLEKFDGDEHTPENLLERVYLHNGTLVKHEWYEKGELVAVREIGGNDGAN